MTVRNSKIPARCRIGFRVPQATFALGSMQTLAVRIDAPWQIRMKHDEDID